MLKTLRTLSLALGLALLATPTLAVNPDEILPDPAQEARARALSAQLRCLQCQNQSIDDSDAPFSREIRVLLREKIAVGKSDEEVLDFLVARYGQFVLLKPQFNALTAVLWLGPFAALAAGGAWFWRQARRRRVNDAILFSLTEEEEGRLEKLLTEAEEANLTKN